MKLRSETLLWFGWVSVCVGVGGTAGKKRWGSYIIHGSPFFAYLNRCKRVFSPHFFPLLGLLRPALSSGLFKSRCLAVFSLDLKKRAVRFFFIFTWCLESLLCSFFILAVTQCGVLTNVVGQTEGLRTPCFLTRTFFLLNVISDQKSHKGLSNTSDYEILQSLVSTTSKQTTVTKPHHVRTATKGNTKPRLLSPCLCPGSVCMCVACEPCSLSPSRRTYPGRGGGGGA